jgi:integrase
MRTWNKLTATFVRGLRKPGKWHDGNGLMLLATATERKGVVRASWLFRYQIHHRERWMGLGSVKLVGLAEARAKAHEARRLLADGIDPIARRDADRAAARAAELHTATFRQCLDGLLASRGDAWREKHLRQWQNSMATYAKPLFPVRVADVDAAMVVKILEPEWKRAPVTADRVRQRIGEVLAYGTVRGWRGPGLCPTRWKGHLDKLLPAPRTLMPVQHHPAMPYADVPALMRKLLAVDAIPELCLAFAILTATRSAEVRGARWDEFDFQTNIWSVPPSRMKRKRPHRVPLSDAAVALLARLPRTSEYLFALGARPVVAHTLRKVLARVGGPGATVHGFRSSFRDWGGERTNMPRELLEVALSHRVGDATEISYARGDLLERRRRLMEEWSRFLTTPPSTAPVVPLRRRHG